MLGGWRWKRSQRAGYVALVLVVVHLVVLGVKGWLAPKGWHGGQPPISLMAALVALVPLLVKRGRRLRTVALLSPGLWLTYCSLWPAASSIVGVGF
jgi:DMSO/TMAO reductase YedYZ heme-binding membrane subunit